MVSRNSSASKNAVVIIVIIVVVVVLLVVGIIVVVIILYKRGKLNAMVCNKTGDEELTEMDLIRSEGENNRKSEENKSTEFSVGDVVGEYEINGIIGRGILLICIFFVCLCAYLYI
jgi:flagellar basal body-associated protein FliL